MAHQQYFYTFICLYLFYTFDVISAGPACDKSKCKGPLKYYEDFNCTPIYGDGDSCCPIEYNCDNLKGRSPDKCYYKGHEYKINEGLRKEDANPCDKSCHCRKLGDVAQFSCAVVDCFRRPKPGCYLKDSDTECCGGDEVCLQPGKKLAECKVDGKTYLDGQRFEPKSDPTKTCICGEGYTGKNVAPFCNSKKPSSCGSELRHAGEIYRNCAPVFYSNQNPATDCHLSSRCQNNKDIVLKSSQPASPAKTASTCSYGQLTLKLGEELNASTGYASVCVKCICEVPPIVTCQRLPDDECDVTVHPKFDDFKK